MSSSNSNYYPNTNIFSYLNELYGKVRRIANKILYTTGQVETLNVPIAEPQGTRRNKIFLSCNIRIAQLKYKKITKPNSTMNKTE